MTVWFPQRKSLAIFDPHVLPEDSIFAKITASHTSPVETVNAIGDEKVPRWTSRPQQGKPQWIEARFHRTRGIRSVGVSWMQDRRDTRLPKQWSLKVQQDGK